jgi:hypothetical protein
LEERAKGLRADLEATADMKKETNALRKEIEDRDAQLVLKVKAIDDLQWKIRKLEHRQTALETSEKELVQTHADKERAWLAREKSMEEQVMALQKSVESLTAANSDLSVKLRDMPSAAASAASGMPSAAASAAHVPSSPRAYTTTAMTSEEQHAEVEVLRRVVLHLRSEVVRLRGMNAHQKLVSQLPPLPRLVSSTSSAINTATSPSPAAAVGQVSASHRAIVHSLVLPHVIDLKSGSPVEQLQRSHYEQQKLRALAEKAKASALPLLPATATGPITPQPSAASTALLLGRLEIPSLRGAAASGHGSVPVTLDHTQFAALHSVFVK